MKRRIVWGLILCVSTGLMTLAARAAESTSTTTSTTEAAVKDKIVVVKLDGEISETPPGIDLGLSDLQMNIFWDQLRLIRMVKEDKTVKGLVLLINQPELSLAQCQQVAMELAKLRAAGKKIYVHADSIRTSLYMLALPADRIAMSPGSELEMNGLAAQILYYKRLMDKLGIEADVIHLGKFKLFAEPYTTTRPSKYMDEQINSLLDSLYGQIVDSIARHRKLTADKVREIIDQGPFLAEQAKDFGLIDAAEHRADLLETAQKQLKGKLVYNYAKSQAPQLKSGFSGLLQIFSMVGSKGSESGGNKIAVVYVTGIVMEGESTQVFGPAESAGSETMRKAFAEIRKDNKIKAVVVRVDSPGGSSAASEIIWGLIHEAAKTRPVIASMSTTAGSGGYYIASAASYIFASPATMTGSIGVIVGKPILKGLLDKICLDAYSYTRGKNATIYDPLSGLTEGERKTVTEQMEMTLRMFKDRVMAGRQGKIKDIDALATGRVYTGQEGIGLGLVDKVGTLADAVVMAADRAKIKSYEVVNLPSPKSLPELLLEGLGYKTDSEDITSEDLRMLGSVGRDLLAAAGVDRAVLRRTMRLIQLMRTGKVLAISPYQIGIK